MKKTEEVIQLPTSSDGFDCSKIQLVEREKTIGITLWIPVAHKEKYDLLQAQSGQEFGKYLKAKVIDEIIRAKTGRKSG